MIVELTREELQKCNEFAYKCAQNQQSIEFGQSDTIPRSANEIGRDNLIGKIAEVAFAKMMLQDFNIKIELDFEYYPRGEWDDQDTIINDWKIDVKGTRQGGKWMLIEWSKINFRQRDKDLSHLFVMASVSWDRDTDRPTGKVDLVGSASILKLQRNQKKTVVIRKGELLPNTRSQVKLQADNYGIKFEDLEHNWKFVINYILTHEPPALDDYPNPYTGETYRTLFPDDYLPMPVKDNSQNGVKKITLLDRVKKHLYRRTENELHRNKRFAK